MLPKYTFLVTFGGKFILISFIKSSFPSFISLHMYIVPCRQLLIWWYMITYPSFHKISNGLFSVLDGKSCTVLESRSTSLATPYIRNIEAQLHCHSGCTFTQIWGKLCLQNFFSATVLRWIGLYIYFLTSEDL